MSKATILIVDDEALIRWSLSERLKSEGYEVLEADTGRAALERVGDGVDLVLLDYRLPDTDGVTVLRKIKERFDELRGFRRPESAKDELGKAAQRDRANRLGTRRARRIHGKPNAKPVRDIRLDERGVACLDSHGPFQAPPGEFPPTPYPITCAAWLVLLLIDRPTTSRSPPRISGISAERAAWLGGVARVVRNSSASMAHTGMKGSATKEISAIRSRSQTTMTVR